MRRAGALIAAALAATLAVPMLLGGRDALWQTLHLPARDYLAIFGVIAVSWIARPLKIMLLLRQLGVHVGFMRMFLISLATDFGFISTPGGLGGYAASVFYLRRAGASVSGAATITAVDQVLDLGFFTLVLPIAGLTLIASDLPRALAALAFGTSALVIALALIAVLALKRVGAWLFGSNWVSRRWPGLKRRQQALREFAASLKANTRVLVAGGPGFMLAAAALTTAQWLGRYGVLWAALAVVGYDVSFALTLLLQSLVLHAAMWTGMPSGGGGAEIGLGAALAHWVPATDLATALLLWRMATLYVCLAAGAVAVALLAHRRAESTHVHIAHESSAAQDGAEEGAH